MPRTRPTLQSMASPLRRRYRSSLILMGSRRRILLIVADRVASLAHRQNESGRIVTVVYTLSGDRVRLISAQERRRERREYEKAKKEKGD